VASPGQRYHPLVTPQPRHNPANSPCPLVIWISLIGLFWQISALDLESLNVKYYFTSNIFRGFFFCVFFRVAFLTLWEHKILGYIGICMGTNKVGFLGILQPFRNAIMLFSLDVSCLLSWRMRQQAPLKHWYLWTRLHGVMSQNTIILIVIKFLE